MLLFLTVKMCRIGVVQGDCRENSVWRMPDLVGQRNVASAAWPLVAYPWETLYFLLCLDSGGY